MEKFFIDDYLRKDSSKCKIGEIDFQSLCKQISSEFQKEWENSENLERMLEIQKNAIIGYDKEVAFFKNKIRQYVIKQGFENVAFPSWYESLEDAVYQENWGLAGISEWFSEKYRWSSSCKVIGDRIYFQEGGKAVLKHQRISKERREQLVRAFLLLTPEERLDKDFQELYTKDGIRITIFRGNAVKENQDVMVFRRYVIPNYTFEEQVARGTIPQDSVEFMKNMVKLGYSVAITGAMRSGKTSFLATMQAYEDETLEGVMLETDPEISLHKLMPNAPIVQVIAKGDDMKHVVKHLLRSDADYLIMAEARDGVALDTVLRMASKGTRRMKITFHERNPLNFPYDVAAEIQLSLGGKADAIAKRAADSFDYIFHFVQLRDKSQKRLKGIYEISWNKEEDKINIVQICKYDYEHDSWKWRDYICQEKKIDGIEENANVYKEFARNLKSLAIRNPMEVDVE